MASKKQPKSGTATKTRDVPQALQNNSLSFSNISHSELNDMLPPLPGTVKPTGSGDSSNRDDSG